MDIDSEHHRRPIDRGDAVEEAKQARRFIQEAQKKQKRSILEKVGAAGLSKEDRSQLLRSLQELAAKDGDRGDDTDPDGDGDVLSILGVDRSEVDA